MKKPIIDRVVLRLLLVLAASCMLARDAESRDLPNIVLILADDLGYGDLGCYGQKKIQTPRLDTMARTGMRFTQHYAGNTVCAPTRCCLMTGLHSGHAFVRGNRQQMGAEGQLALPDDELTIAEVLKQAGYTTGMFGKWGLGNPETTGDPLKQGWDTYFGYTDQIRAHNYFPDFLLRDGQKIPLDNEVTYLSNRSWHKGIGSYSTKQNVYSHDAITESALDFVRANQQRPFFLYLPFTLPHDNGEAPDVQMEVPDFGRYAKKVGWSPNQKGYAEMVTRLDRSVGELLDLLSDLKLDRRTLVLFTSDNGPVRDRLDRKDRMVTEFFDSNGPLRGFKSNVYEGGLRVPLIAQWPGTIAPGTERDHISAHWDYLATLCDVAGINAPASDGISFLPTLLGDDTEQKQHRYLYWEDGGDGDIAIRTGRWKAVLPELRRNPNAEFEIYDLSADIGEMTNLASSHSDRGAEFRRIFKEAHEPSQHFLLPIDPR